MKIVRSIGFALTRLATAYPWPVTVNGLEKLRDHKGAALVFFEHPSYVEPALGISYLGPYFGYDLRPVAHSKMYDALKPIMKRVDAIRIESTAEGSSDRKRWKIGQSKKRISAAVKAGSSIFLSPGGQTKRGENEEFGGKSAAHELHVEFPHVPIYLVRIKGLRGSIFSRYATDGASVPTAAEMKQLRRDHPHIKWDRLPVTMTIERADFLRGAQSLVDFNRKMEAWFAAEPDPVAKGRENVKVVREKKVDAETVALDAKISQKVIKHLANEAKVDIATITPEKELIQDLGLDSLATSTLPLWVEEQYAVNIAEGTELNTVRDVIVAAMGIGSSKATARDIAPPKGWVEKKRRVAAFPTGATSLIDAFLRQRDRFGDKAVICGDDILGVTTMKQLVVRVILFARIMQKRPEKRIAIALPASVGALTMQLAAFLAGKTIVPLNFTGTAQSLDDQIRLSEVEVIYTSDLFLDKGNIRISDAANEKMVAIDTWRKEQSFGDKLTSDLGLKGLLASKRIARKSRKGILRHFNCTASKDDEAVILFTSGSEGVPKGVVVTHGEILATIDAALDAITARPDDVMQMDLPTFHMFGTELGAMLCAVAGLKTWFDPNPWDAIHVAHSIRRTNATLKAATPLMHRGVLSSVDPGHLACMRLALAGAEAVPQSMIDGYKCHETDVIEGYGSTEAGLVAVNRPGEKKIGVGRPVKGVTVKILSLDDWKTELPPGGEGLIVVKGPGVSKRYLGNVEWPKIALADGEYLSMGDIGKFVEGNVVLTGRVKEQYSFGGEKYDRPAIEKPLTARWPADENGPVIAVNGENRDHQPAAIAVYTRDRDITLDQIFETLKAGHVPSFAWPRVIHYLDEIPKLGSGKVNLKALPSPKALAEKAA